MALNAILQKLTALVEEKSKTLPEPLHLVEGKTFIEPSFRFKSKEIFFSNACISTLMLYELYHKYKKYIHRLLLYNVLISNNFQKGYLYNVAFLLEKFEKEIYRFNQKMPKCENELNIWGSISFMIGHEFGHAKFKFDPSLKEKETTEVVSFLKELGNETHPSTFRERMAFNGAYEYISRKKLIEELACDKTSILEYFKESIPPNCDKERIQSFCRSLVRTIAMRQFPTNIAKASVMELSKKGIMEYRNMHRFDVFRIGLATMSIVQCFIDDLDESFIEFFQKETLTYHKVLDYSLFDWIKQFNTVAAVSDGKYCDDESLFVELQNIFDLLQIELIKIIESKSGHILW